MQDDDKQCDSSANGGVCTNTSGDYTCSCDSSHQFKLSTTDDQYDCEDKPIVDTWITIFITQTGTSNFQLNEVEFKEGTRKLTVLDSRLSGSCSSGSFSETIERTYDGRDTTNTYDHYAQAYTGSKLYCGRSSSSLLHLSYKVNGTPSSYRLKTANDNYSYGRWFKNWGTYITTDLITSYTDYRINNCSQYSTCIKGRKFQSNSTNYPSNNTWSGTYYTD